jgi:hypothetical protein
MATFPNPLTSKFLDAAIEERPDKKAIKQSYIGLSLLPMKPVPDYELNWDVIKHQNHVAGIYSHTGVPIPGDSPGFYQLIADVINIMASRVMDDQTVMVLREPGELAVHSQATRALRQKAKAKLAEYLGESDDEVDVTVEYLIMEVLQGVLHWPPRAEDGTVIASAPAYWGNVSFTIDLGFRSEFVQDISALVGYDSRSGGGQNWKHASADPVLDLEVIAELMTELTGLNMKGATLIMSRSVLSWIATRTNVLQWFRATDSGQKFIDTSSLKTFLETKLGYKIVTYDAKWTYSVPSASESGVTEVHVRFLPPGKMIVIPAGALGMKYAYFATAPTSGADDSYRTGKYTWAEKLRKPPWTWELGVGLKGFPIMKTVNEIAIFDVYS